MTPAELIANANGDMEFSAEVLEAAAFILHLIEHGYGDDEAEAAYGHWSGYPKKIRQQGHDDAARVLRAAMGAAGLVVVSAEDLRAYLYRGSDLKREVEAMNRLRAALPERTDHADRH
ncbi:hypothetical protein ABZ917_17625 [Nonomuraea wenchangensis]